MRLAIAQQGGLADGSCRGEYLLHSRRIILAALVLLVFPAGVTRAQVSSEQMRTEARACRDRASEAMRIYEDLIARHIHHEAYVRPELPLVKASYEAAAEAWRTCADAYDEEDAATATALRIKAEETGRACGMWRERLDTREKQALAAPTEGQYSQFRYNTGSAAKIALGNLMESRRNAADAWGLLAESMVLSADPQKLANLREQALVTAGEVEIATATFTAVDRRERLAKDAGPGSPQVTEALAKLKRADEDRIAAMRDEIQHAARLRAIDQRRVQIEDEVRQAIDAARRAAEKK
jgi:hypothetical protein